MPIEILMPALSPTMEEGTLSKWLVKAGEKVSPGDILAEIETDKATMEVEAVDEGILARILVEDGTEGVKVNRPIALLLAEDEDAASMENYTPQMAQGITDVEPESKNDSPVLVSDQPDLVESATPESPAFARNLQRIKASPLARRLAKEHGLTLEHIKGTGPYDRIIKTDIERTLQSPRSGESEKPPARTEQSTDLAMPLGGGAVYLEKMGILPGSYDLEPLDGMRRAIVQRLSASNAHVPDFPLTIDCELDTLLALRKDLNSRAEDGVKISVTDMLIRASALSLKAFSQANASYTPNGIAYHHHADIAVAVAIDGGLITPIIRAAENKGLAHISTEMKALAKRARERKLQPQEYQGGTFSLSNLGMFGIRNFGSIINEPHGMILSVGAGQPRPVVRGDTVVIATVMTLTLSCDHRVVDGAVGAQWLQHFQRYVEQPITMML